LLALLERQGRFTDAEQVLRRLPAGTAALNEHRLSIALGKEDFASALDELNQRIAAESENASLLVLKAGLIHSLQKNVSEALSWLDKAEALQPDLLDIAGTRAAILHAAGRTDEARRILDELVSKRQDTAAYLLRSRLSLQTKQFEQAEQDLLQAASHEGPNEEGHLALGRFYQEQGREVPAITAYEQGLKRNPTQLELQRGLLGVLLKSAAAESRERGRKLLDELRGKYPDDTRLIAVAADFKLQEKTPAAMKEASTLLERVVTLDPRNVAVYVRLIELAQQREDRRSVDALISRAMGANPGDDDLQLVRAGIESEAGNVAVSRELGRSVLDRARRTISQDSSDEAARRRLLGACTLLADLALRGKDSAEARRYSEEALKTDPSGEQAQLSHARVLDATGQAAEAISVLEAYRQSEAGHDNVSTLVALSDLYRRQRNFTSAEDRLREALAKRPESLAVQFAQLQLFASQKRWNDVAERLSEGGANTEVDPRVALLGATLLIDSGDDRHLAKARAICDQLVAKQPDRVDAQITLAQVAYRQRQLPVSEQAYRHVLQIEPYHVQALNDLAWILAVDQGQPEQALALADKGALRFPDDPHLLDTRGVVYTMLNRLPEARRDFERCLALSALPLESRAQALFHLGRVLVKQGETAAAQSKLHEANKLDEQHRVFSDGERAEIRNLIGSP